MKMTKKKADAFLADWSSGRATPITQEELVAVLRDEFHQDDREFFEIKLREYVREFIKKHLKDRLAGGVIYPEETELVLQKGDVYGLSTIWREMVELCHDEGISFGPRKILPNVHVTGADLRMGIYHYRRVGYSSASLMKAWDRYFPQAELDALLGELEGNKRIGYSTMFRCHPIQEEGDEIPCLDSITITYLSQSEPLVHANYRVSNLNRMTLVDLHMLHRFCRYLFPLEDLPKVKLSMHFSMLALDEHMTGWLGRIKKLKRVVDECKRHEKETGYRAVDNANAWAAGKDNNEQGINTFIRNNYGLESLLGTPFDPQITYYSR